VLGQVDQVFQIAGLAGETVNVIEDHPVDRAVLVVVQHLPELRPDHPPHAPPVRQPDALLPKRRGVVLLIPPGDPHAESLRER